MIKIMIPTLITILIVITDAEAEAGPDADADTFHVYRFCFYNDSLRRRTYD